MNYSEESLKKHYEWNGKIEIKCRVPVKTPEDLSLCYTPGVAAPCLEIKKDISKSFLLTRRSNTVAVITNGSAVLGLGNIGPVAGMPVMEGKCALFKELADIDAVPLCIRSDNADEIIRTINLISGSFGGINLEDISAPMCFEIEENLKQSCDIPVFHDDQHGTAVVTLAALINALKIVNKNINHIKIVINGAGAAGTAIAKLLISVGAGNIIVCDRKGSIYTGRSELNSQKMDIAKITNPEKENGTLEDVIRMADVFIGVSSPDCVTKKMVRSMAADPVLFTMANPDPEILPGDALSAGAAVIGTGRSDYPNQINNVLAFPGIFRGVLDTRAQDITDDMKIAAAKAIADIIPENELSADHIIPSPLDKSVASAVAEAVKRIQKKEIYK